MNIFKALRKGNGKAVLPGFGNYAKRVASGLVYWYVENCDLIDILPCHLESDDWLPYEEPITSDVPRGTNSFSAFDQWKLYFELYFKLKNAGFNEETIRKILTTPE